MERKRTYYIVIIISLLIHLLLIWLIAFYPNSSTQQLSFEPAGPKTAETVFYQEPEPQLDEQIQEWAQLKPRASTLGPSMEFEPEIPIDINKHDSETTDTPEQEQSSDQPNQEENLTQTENGIQDIAALARDSAFSSEKKVKLKKAAAKKQEAQKILAAMTSNYLEQLHNEGNNLIKTIGGNPDALPTKDQLLYERYLAKLHWCLNNAQAILQDPSAFKETIHTTMKIQFLLDRQGKMSNFTVHQSSGSPIADAYITELFTYASSSFPPLPSFIKQNPLPLFYTVLINWDQSHYTRFARQ